MITNILIKFQQENKDNKERSDKNFKELWNKLASLQDQVGKRFTIEKEKELEEMLLNRLKELAEELIKRFADKAETKRALKYLEKLIKDSESVKIVRDGDAMLARKPLGDWSSASC
jgi:hypothetical protein